MQSRFIFLNIWLVAAGIGADVPLKKIAILSYGSLVNLPSHSVTGAKLQASSFSPTSIMFPINLSLLANTQRITAVVDTQEGSPRRVWAAISKFTILAKAVQNLAAREGAKFLGKDKGYDTTHIYYVYQKTDDPQSEWVIRNDLHERQQLSPEIINNIISWAQEHDCIAVIWASCPIDVMPQKVFINHLLANAILLKNAQYYVNLLPNGAQTPLEKAILGGYGSLKKLLLEKLGNLWVKN